jgi:hypothetical protein
MWSDENSRKPSRNEIVWTIASLRPSGCRIGSSRALTAGSPIQPRPSEAMVIPS